MDIVLLGLTVVSLVVAFAMSATAWRLSREERLRSAARVTALAAAASDAEPLEAPQPRTAPAAEAVSDRVAVGEARQAPWSAPRVSAFGSGARQPSAARSLPRDAELIMHPVFAEESSAVPTLADGFLGGAAAHPASDNRQRGLAAAAVVLFALTLIGGYWTLFGGRGTARAASASAAEASPLELVSLRHERRGPRLAVTGLVRNPVAGGAIDKLTAVVFLFDRDGGLITSGRAPVDFLKLTPGDESPFVIDLDAPPTVARYRVSFRSDNGVVPHVDRRGQEPVAPNAVSQNAAASR
jgi:hypothetical protein